jgi:hypothetical protein
MGTAILISCDGRFSEMTVVTPAYYTAATGYIPTAGQKPLAKSQNVWIGNRLSKTTGRRGHFTPQAGNRKQNDRAVANRPSKYGSVLLAFRVANDVLAQQP